MKEIRIITLRVAVAAGEDDPEIDAPEIIDWLQKANIDDGQGRILGVAETVDRGFGNRIERDSIRVLFNSAGSGKAYAQEIHNYLIRGY